jgi:hypothetical protein
MDDVVIYDGSKQPFDLRLFGRTQASWLHTKNDFVYSQDDDIVHTPDDQLRILSEYEPGVLTGCMWDEWSDEARRQGVEDGYDDLVFMGSGSVYDYRLPHEAAATYLEHFPEDDFFYLWADTIIGVIAPTKQLDIRFKALPHAEAANRICNQPDAVALKTEAIRRARQVREAVYA